MLPLLVLVGFALAVAAAIFEGAVPPLLAAYYVALSLATFGVYAYDKSAAIDGRRRTRERTLHLLSLAGGWPGAVAGQQLLRHKSRKAGFRLVFYLTVVLNCTLLVAVSVAFREP